MVEAVEDLMRLDHPTLDALDRAEFDTLASASYADRTAVMQAARQRAESRRLRPAGEPLIRVATVPEAGVAGIGI